MQIGPYQLTRCLGRGGMGEVWLGKRTAMGSAAKVVAVKLLRTPDAAARDNFVKEAKLAMLLRHSTIVQVNDVGESSGTCYMEMEWVDGLDLARLGEWLRARGQPLDLGVAAYVIGELLKALAFAHALDVDGKRETIVHRDVTPQNVLISKSGEVKLTDFGIAFMTSDKTSSEFVKGKSRYMSPEHVRQVREPCIDIFGVGAIFHELVDGRKFRHTAASDVDLWAMAFAGDVPPLAVELPAELEAFRRGLLARELGERFAGARAALAALRRWPGYRDASEELEALVRAVMASAPVEATEVLPAAFLANEATDPERSGEQAAATDAVTASVPFDEATEVLLPGPERSAAQAEATGAASPTRSTMPLRRDGRWLAVPLALIGLGIGGWSLSMLLGGSDTKTAAKDAAPVVEQAPVENTPSEPAPSEARPPVEPMPTEPTPTETTPVEPPPPTEPTPVEPTPVEPTPVEAPPPTEPTPAEPKPTETTPTETKPAKTSVTLSSAYPWVKLRIGTTTHVLDRKTSPTKKVSLKPGPHAVAFQVDEEEPWQELGKVTIPAQPSATLTLQKPGKVVVE